MLKSFQPQRYRNSTRNVSCSTHTTSATHIYITEKMKAAWRRTEVLQSKCAVTPLLKTKSTTAFLSVSTASIKAISVIQQQVKAVIKKKNKKKKKLCSSRFFFTFSCLWHKLCGGQARYVSTAAGNWKSEMRWDLYLQKKPNTVGFELCFERSCSTRLRRTAGKSNAETMSGTHGSPTCYKTPF